MLCCTRYPLHSAMLITITAVSTNAHQPRLYVVECIFSATSWRSTTQWEKLYNIRIALSNPPPSKKSEDHDSFRHCIRVWCVLHGYVLWHFIYQQVNFLLFSTVSKSTWQNPQYIKHMKSTEIIREQIFEIIKIQVLAMESKYNEILNETHLIEPSDIRSFNSLN